MGFLYTLAVEVNSSGEGKKLRLLHIELFYCNLQVILYQKIIDLLCLGAWSQSLLTQNFPCGVGVDVCLSKLWYFDTK